MMVICMHVLSMIHYQNAVIDRWIAKLVRMIDLSHISTNE
jgi:hypothetical protein